MNDWIIIIDNNEEDGVDIYKFTGTKEDIVKTVKALAMQHALDAADMNVESISFGDYNTDTYYSAYIQCLNHNCSIDAIRTDFISEMNNSYFNDKCFSKADSYRDEEFVDGEKLKAFFEEMEEE